MSIEVTPLDRVRDLHCNYLEAAIAQDLGGGYFIDLVAYSCRFDLSSKAKAFVFSFEGDDGHNQFPNLTYARNALRYIKSPVSALGKLECNLASPYALAYRYCVAYCCLRRPAALVAIRERASRAHVGHVSIALEFTARLFTCPDLLECDALSSTFAEMATTGNKQYAYEYLIAILPHHLKICRGRPYQEAARELMDCVLNNDAPSDCLWRLWNVYALVEWHMSNYHAALEATNTAQTELSKVASDAKCFHHCTLLTNQSQVYHALHDSHTAIERLVLAYSRLGALRTSLHVFIARCHLAYRILHVAAEADTIDEYVELVAPTASETAFDIPDRHTIDSVHSYLLLLKEYGIAVNALGESGLSKAIFQRVISLYRENALPFSEFESSVLSLLSS